MYRKQTTAHWCALLRRFWSDYDDDPSPPPSSPPSLPPFGIFNICAIFRTRQEVSGLLYARFVLGMKGICKVYFGPASVMNLINKNIISA